MRSRLAARAAVSLLTLALAAGDDSVARETQPAEATELLLEIPEPNFEGADPSVAASILEQIEATRRLVDTGTASPAELAKAFGELGQSLLLYDLLAAAEAAFRNAATLVPGDHRAPYYLGVIAQELRRLDEAIERFEAVLEIDPRYVSALVRLGDIEMLENRPERANSYYQRVLELYPSSPAAHWGLGQLAASTGDPATAVRHFEAVLEAQPSASAAHYPLALAYRELGEIDKAREHLALRGQQSVQRVDPLIDGLARRVTGASLYMTRGNHAFDRGEFAVAIDAYSKAVEADPNNTTALHALASALSRDGRIDDAVAGLLRLLELDDSDAVAHYNLGTLYSELGDAERSLEHIERAVELSPDLVNARFNLGFLLEQLGRYDEALEQYAEIRRLDPQDTAATVRQAALNVRLGKTAQAESDLRSVLAVDPANTDARMALAAAFAAAGRSEAALAELGVVLASTRDTQLLARAHFDSGQLLLAAGDIAGAVREFERTVALMPGIIEAREALANALARSGRFGEAAEQFARAVELNPDRLQAHLGRAIALLLDRRDAEARASLESSLRQLPDSVELAHLLARVLASSEDDSVRDGVQALELARQVDRRLSSLPHRETVAMALAELGRFDEARALQEEIVHLAGEAADPEMARIEGRLRLYESGRPARAPWRN